MAGQRVPVGATGSSVFEKEFLGMPDEARGMFLTFDRLKGRFWQYSHENGMVATETFMFNDDGTVGNYSNNNERFWEIRDGVLSLISVYRAVTVTFDTAVLQNGLLTLKGCHIPRPAIVLCLKERQGIPKRPQHNQTRDALAENINRHGWSIGAHTYGVPGFLEPGRAGLTIGKYCSIAGGVKISFGDHDVSLPSTYPFRGFSSFWPNVPNNVQHHTTKGDVVIGNDVWIGTDAFIGSGVTIGDGAVIGAKAVVVKDVPPYGIAVGNPARVVRYRFTPDVIRDMLRFRWWDLEDDAVDSLLPVMLSGDMSAFLSALRISHGQDIDFSPDVASVAPAPLSAEELSALDAHRALFDPSTPPAMPAPVQEQPHAAHGGMLKRFQRLVGL
jgi:acetyltransferase-like isoleucine patch superfamily enzyme